MFIDASAIVAILRREPGYESLVRRIEDFPAQRYTSPLARYVAAVSFARQRAGIERKPDPALVADCAALVEAFIAEVGAKDIHITSGIGDAAIRAAAAYGKAVGHPADLNFGDCFAYACAKAFHVRLVYTGNDFALTDLG